MSLNKKKEPKEIRSVLPFVKNLKRTFSVEKDIIRDNIQRAIQEKDYGALRRYVAGVRKKGIDRLEEEYEVAVEMITRHDHLLAMQEITIRSLVHAIHEADRQLLKSAILQAEDTQLVAERCKELRDAKELLNRLEIGSRLFQLHKVQSFDRANEIRRVVNKMTDALRFADESDTKFGDALTTFGTFLQEAKTLKMAEDHEVYLEVTRR